MRWGHVDLKTHARCAEEILGPEGRGLGRIQVPLERGLVTGKFVKKVENLRKFWEGRWERRGEEKVVEREERQKGDRFK